MFMVVRKSTLTFASAIFVAVVVAALLGPRSTDREGPLASKTEPSGLSNFSSSPSLPFPPESVSRVPVLDQALVPSEGKLTAQDTYPDESNCTLLGGVYDGKGTPLADYRLIFFCEGNAYRTTSNESGQYRMEEIVPGRVLVGHDGRDSSTIVVESYFARVVLAPNEELSLDLIVPDVSASFEMEIDWGVNGTQENYSFPVTLRSSSEAEGAWSFVSADVTRFQVPSKREQVLPYLEMTKWELEESGLGPADVEEIERIKNSPSELDRLDGSSPLPGFKVSALHSGHYSVSIELGKVTAARGESDPIVRGVFFKTVVDLTQSPSEPIVLTIDWDQEFRRAADEIVKSF